MTIKMTIAYNLWFLQKDRSGTMVEQLKHFYMIHSHGCQFWVDQKQKKHDLESLFICTQNLTNCFGCFMIRNRKVDRKNHQLVIGEFVEKPPQNWRPQIPCNPWVLFFYDEKIH